MIEQMIRKHWTTGFHSKKPSGKSFFLDFDGKSGLNSALDLSEVRRKIKNEYLKKIYFRNKKDWFSRKKLSKKIFCQIKNGKRKIKIINISKDALLFKRKENIILNAFFPNRKKEWLNIANRKREKTKIIKIKNFNLIDEPKNTFSVLTELVKAESQNRSVEIDFLDQSCEDVTPYMIFALMKSDMAPINKGGRISPAVTSVVQAVGLDIFLGIHSVIKFHKDPVCFPFKLRIRRKTGTSTSQDVSFQPSEKEYISDKLIDTINHWFKLIASQAKNKSGKCHQLSATGKQRVQTMVTEALDNATRHSDLTNEDGGWAIAGFMSAIKEDESSDPSFFCTIGIVSEGASIYQSIKTCTDSNTIEQMDKYVNLHKDKISEEILVTIFALQDGVSRISNVKGGVGLMEIVQFVRDMGMLGEVNKSSAMTLISGRTCLMIRRPYVDMIKTDEENGNPLDSTPRRLWFNEENSYRLPPDSSVVQTLDVDFPGTVIAIRFCIKPDIDLG